MADRAAIVVTGASGRMGRTLSQLVLADPRTRLVAALERPGHPWIGQDLGVAQGQAPVGVTVTDDALAAFAQAQAVLDFTAPAASVAFAGLAAQARAVHVLGTTGLQPADLAAVTAAARHAVMIRSGNFGQGINLLLGLTRAAARALGPDWDIEIVETHHRMKVDAPSGTALMLGQAAAEGRGVTLAEVADRGRDGETGARVPGHIGFAAIRGGDIVGEHDVILAGPGERVVLRHVATDRGIFARGALAAALWGLGQPPGEYDMLDVLGMAG